MAGLLKSSLKFLGQITRNVNTIMTRDTVRGLQSLTQPIIKKPSNQEVRTCVKPENGEVLLQSKTKPLYNHESVRTAIRHHYRPSAWKRIHKHGLEKRLSTPSGRELMFRRFLRGRRHLCVFDRFLNHTVEKKQKGRRINLFDPKQGYKKLKIKKDEHYRYDNYKSEWRVIMGR